MSFVQSSTKELTFPPKDKDKGGQVNFSREGVLPSGSPQSTETSKGGPQCQTDSSGNRDLNLALIYQLERNWKSEKSHIHLQNVVSSL